MESNTSLDSNEICKDISIVIVVIKILKINQHF